MRPSECDPLPELEENEQSNGNDARPDALGLETAGETARWLTWNGWHIPEYHHPLRSHEAHDLLPLASRK